MAWTPLCSDSIRLRDYGNVKCLLRQGHEGNHHATSPYDSRDIYWTPTAEEAPK